MAPAVPPLSDPARIIASPDPEETIGLMISLSCITVMSLLFGRKTAGTKLNTINYARGLVIALYIDSWLFSFMATHLAHTNNNNPVSCKMSIYSCICLYASSKIIIYLFLMEKVYVVTAVGMLRRDFKLYRVNLCLMLPFLGIIYLMVKYRVAVINDRGECRIGIYPPASLPLILYDLFLSSWLTFLFIWPLMSTQSMLQGPTKGGLRDVARRTLIGAIVAMILSSINIFTLVYFQGNERGLMCLTSCTADVTLNAITIHWVTSRASTKPKGEAGIGLQVLPPTRRNERQGAHGKREEGCDVGRGKGRGWHGVWGDLEDIGAQGYNTHGFPVLERHQGSSVDSHISVEVYMDDSYQASSHHLVHNYPPRNNNPSFPSPMFAGSGQRRASLF